MDTKIKKYLFMQVNSKEFDFDEIVGHNRYFEYDIPEDVNEEKFIQVMISIHKRIDKNAIVSYEVREYVPSENTYEITDDLPF